MIKGSSQDITVVNTCAPIISIPKSIRQKLTERTGEINGNTVIEGDFNTPLRTMEKDHPDRESIIKEN